LTNDLDVVYERTPENIERLARALAPLHPYLRGAPEGLPFRFDPPTIKRRLNFTLRTDAGHFDLLGRLCTSVILSEAKDLRSFSSEKILRRLRGSG
jgi:hypothetical protein